jgi:hypothetical protein
MIQLSCPALQIVTELRMGDAYKLARSFQYAAAAQFCYAVLGNNTVNYVLERGDRRAGMKLRHDAGDRLVRGCRVQHDKRLAVLGEDRPTCEVRLATRRRPVLAAKRLRGTLAEEVDFEGGVDGAEAIFSCNVALVVGVVDGTELDAGILLHELLQTVAAQRVARDGFVPVAALAGAGDNSVLYKVMNLSESSSVLTPRSLWP